MRPPPAVAGSMTASMSTPKETEAALIRELRQSEARLRLATKAGNIGLWDWDFRTHRVSYSAEWKSQLGYEPHEISDDFREWRDRLHAEDLAPSLKVLEEFLSNPRPTYSNQFRMRHRDGSFRWILAHGSLVCDEHGDPERLIGSHVDITAQKDAEQASRTEIRGIQDCLVDGLLVVDAETRSILRVNRAMSRLFGYSEDELLALQATALHPPEAVAEAMRCLDNPFVPGNAVARGIPCLRADGRVFLAEMTSHPIELGGRKCVIGFIRDATDILANERRLRDSERQLQEQLAELADVYKNSPVGLCVVDRDLRYVRINERLAEINGKSIEQHVGHTIHEVLPELADRFVAMWRPIFETGRPLLDVEIRGETPKSPHLQRHWVSSFFPMVSTSGEVTGLMAAVVEITGRKRAEERLRESEAKYRALIEATDTGFVIVDGEGRVVDANEEFVRQSGHASLDEIRNRAVTEWTAPEDLDRNAAEVRKCLATGQTRNFVVAYADGAGRRTVIEVNARVMGTDGDPRILALTRDVTGRQQAEREREQLHEQLRQAQKLEAIGRLSGGVAHDFNNLLTVIQGNAAVATRVLQSGMAEDGRDRLAATLAEIQHAAHQAANLTAQLLTFSRKHVPDVRILELGAVVRDLEKMLRRLIREDIALRIVCDPGEHRIAADRTQIEQILVNLAVNASDAMPDGGHLNIRVGDACLDEAYVQRHVGAATGPHVVILVSDTGTGMDPDTLDHLFEPFFTTKPFGTGTGLGLSIVYGIVQQAGGHITVDSAPGRGSTFALYFPEACGGLPSPAEPPVLEWERGHETVLLCEDEPLVRDLIGAVLTGGGYRVLAAENGEQAVELAAAHTGEFELLITDVVMPGMKGDRVAAAILERQPAVRVLFMSGYASDVLSVESISERAVEFLQKPFRPHVLLQRVREILDKAGG